MSNTCIPNSLKIFLNDLGIGQLIYARVAVLELFKRVTIIIKLRVSRNVLR